MRLITISIVALALAGSPALAQETSNSAATPVADNALAVDSSTANAFALPANESMAATTAEPLTADSEPAGGEAPARRFPWGLLGLLGLIGLLGRAKRSEA